MKVTRSVSCVVVLFALALGAFATSACTSTGMSASGHSGSSGGY
ncbi:MAG TPA: hypothetical protein VFE79_08030 [Paraburkholderia sp.]|jgi:hypothetical protein|nr:hypothetical protein [Paraburkholderia sp.]